MRQGFKQFGKAICYFLLFFGMQQIVGMVMGVWYGILEGMRAATTGSMPDEEALTVGLNTFLAENTTWLVLISGVLSFVFLCVFFGIRKKRFATECQFCKFDSGKIFPIMLLGIATSFTISIALSIIPLPEGLLESYVQTASTVAGGSMVVMILANVIVAPVIEEVIFRGLVLTRLQEGMPIWGAVGISSLLFAVMHGHPLWIGYTFVIGCLMAIVAIRMKSIKATILLHMCFNLTGVCMEYVSVEGGAMIALGVGMCLLMVAMLFVIFGKKQVNMDV